MKKSLLRLIDRVALATAWGDLQTLRLSSPTADARYVGEEARKRLSYLVHDHKTGLRAKWDRTWEKQKGKLRTFWESEATKHVEGIEEARKVLDGVAA